MSLRIRTVVVLVACAGLAVGAASCGSSSGSSDSSQVSSAAAGAQFGVGLKLSGVVGEAEVGSSTGPWLVWNAKSCAYEQTSDHPTDYKAQSRTVAGGPTQIGYMHYGDVDPFGVANSKSVASEAEKVGFTLNTYNLKYPSETEPLAQARNSVLKKDAGVIQAQQVASVTPAFLKILQTDGCIPSVQMYLAVENVPTFGAVWSDVGATQGAWLAKEALARGWKPEDTALVQCTDPTLGEDVNSMFKTGPEALVKGGFALPDSNVYPLKCEFTPQKAAVPVTDWLTAHPDVKNILMQTIDDERMSGMLNAMKQAGRSGDQIDIASGADQLGQEQIKNGVQQASIAYFPEKYGEWLIPILEDVMAGNPVPSFVGQALPVITQDNINDYYPG